MLPDARFGGVSLVPGFSLRGRRGGDVLLARGSPVNFIGDAAVNAANPGGLGGGGVDEAFNRAGGAEFRRARRALPLLADGLTRIPPGTVLVTPGSGSIRATHVIHTVGPDYRRFKRSDFPIGDEILKDAYSAVLKEAKRLGCTTVGSTLVSAGIYRGSRGSIKDVVRVAFWDILHAVPEGCTWVWIAFSGIEMVEMMDLFREKEAKSSA